MTGTKDCSKILDGYDYVVVGSGFAALAFITQTLRLHPKSKILCLERGHDDAEHHYRTLCVEQTPNSARSCDRFDVFPNECPWQLSNVTSTSEQLNRCAGTCYLLGGRSHYWYGWCMQPNANELRQYPQKVIDSMAAPTFWQGAHDLLNLTRVDQLPSVCIDQLQKALESKLTDIVQALPSALVDTCSAYFANGDKRRTSLVRYSVALRLIEISCSGQLDIWTDHTVSALASDDTGGTVNKIYTDRGLFTISNSNIKVVLCAGAIPNATILLNSFPELKGTIGKSIGGHFRSHIFARVQARALLGEDTSLHTRSQWGIGAHIVRGRDLHTGRQFHIQLSVFYCPKYEGRYDEIVADLPRYGPAPLEAHLQGLGNDLIISCTALGELDESNGNSWLRMNDDSLSITSNVELQLKLSENDKTLWDLMDTTTFRVVELLSNTQSDVRYWSDGSQGWVRRRPLKCDIRSSVLVHESGLTPIGSTEHPKVLNESFAVESRNNVFVLGSGTLPTAGSWNPTLTICALSQNLAKSLCSKELNHDKP